MENGLAKGIREVEEKFERGEYFLLDLMLSAEAMKAGLKVLKPEIEKQSKKTRGTGKFLIGTVEGDLHDIGKTIVKTMLTAEGFEVIDLGVDVPDQKFVEKVKKHKPDILGLSALMTTTRIKQRDIINALKKANLRDQVKVMIGGAAVTPEWCEKIGADAFGEDAIDAVNKAKTLISNK